jgi:dolichol-phosphate mannosyltransferase
VVDDGSPDGTADLAEAAGRELGGIEVLRRSEKAGLGGAYRAGFAWGLERGATVLVEMDADLSHDPAALPSLIGPAAAGEQDLVIGSRYVPGGEIPDWAWHRRMLSRWGNRYTAFALGMGVKDATAGYRAYRADLLERLQLESVRADGYGFKIEMAYRAHRAGGRIREVPISFSERERGTSKMSGTIVVEALALVTWWAVRDRVLRRRRT